jgi:hypothetical protein
MLILPIEEEPRPPRPEILPVAELLVVSLLKISPYYSAGVGPYLYMSEPLEESISSASSLSGGAEASLRRRF